MSENIYITTSDTSNKFLSHYGVAGMKWYTSEAMETNRHIFK